jgi:hypothetical protein
MLPPRAPGSQLTSFMLGIISKTRKDLGPDSKGSRKWKYLSRLSSIRHFFSDYWSYNMRRGPEYMLSLRVSDDIIHLTSTLSATAVGSREVFFNPLEKRRLKHLRRYVWES